MNKEILGAFIAESRKGAGLTQRELAERLHVTDKAVSKWERGLSYPDVTLLEPLAEVFGLGVEELVACEKRKEEPPVKAVLEISRENLSKERRQNIQRIIAAAAAMLVIAVGTVWYTSTFVSGQQETILILKETKGTEHYIYAMEGNHLLKLKCGADVDFDSIELEDTLDDGTSYPLIYRLDCRWNRRTYEGTVSSCELLGMYGGTLGMTDINVRSKASNILFGRTYVKMTQENFHSEPFGDCGLIFLSDFRFWTGYSEYNGMWDRVETLLLIEDCLNVMVDDVDGDGKNEIIARTHWPEKPYIIYDNLENDPKETWLDKLPPELEYLEFQLLTPWERFHG